MCWGALSLLSGKPEPGRGFSLNPAVSSPPKRRGLSAALLVPAANTEAPALACRGPSPLCIGELGEHVTLLPSELFTGPAQAGCAQCGEAAGDTGARGRLTQEDPPPSAPKQILSQVSTSLTLLWRPKSWLARERSAQSKALPLLHSRPGSGLIVSYTHCPAVAEASSGLSTLKGGRSALPAQGPQCLSLCLLEIQRPWDGGPVRASHKTSGYRSSRKSPPEYRHVQSSAGWPQLPGACHTREGPCARVPADPLLLMSIWVSSLLCPKADKSTGETCPQGLPSSPGGYLLKVTLCFAVP